jgi:hypothetical protein
MSSSLIVFVCAGIGGVPRYLLNGFISPLHVRLSLSGWSGRVIGRVASWRSPLHAWPGISA